MIDNHCHPFDLEPGLFDLRRLGIDLSEISQAPSEASEIGVPLLWRALLRSRLADRFGVPVEDLAAARADAVRDYPAYVQGLLADAGVTDLVMDPSWPPGSAEMLPEFASVAACSVHPLLRLEEIIDPMIDQGVPFYEIRERFDSALHAAFNGGYRGLKSAIAYRTGLRIDPEVSEQTARGSPAEEGPPRRRAKPLRDFFFLRALEFAAERGIPVQVHTGFGDSDLRLSDAHPSHLEDLLRTPIGSSAPIILLHCGFPFQEEAAFLASAHTNVHIDLSLVGLFAPAALADSFVRVVGLAPPDRVLVGTDAYGLPEAFWLAAHLLREAWEVCSSHFLGIGVAPEWVETTGQAIFEGNARRLYQLEGT